MFPGNAETSTAIFYTGGTTAVEDEWNNIIQVPEVHTTTRAVFSHLSSQEKIARNQLQDDSQFKLYIDNNSVNKLITNKMWVEVNNQNYKINGVPKISPLKHGWITVYITEK